MHPDKDKIEAIMSIHSKEEILNALKIIRDICENNTDSCKSCPFYSDTQGCIINTESPDGWDIKGEEQTWRAFY